MKKIPLTAMALSLLCFSSTASQADDKQKAVPNPYAGADKQANEILNKSLSSIGTCVVVSVQSSGKKETKEYLALIPGYKYSPEVTIKDSIPAGVLDVTGRINEAVDQAKKNNSAKTTITITIERKVPKSVK